MSAGKKKRNHIFSEIFYFSIRKLEQFRETAILVQKPTFVLPRTLLFGSLLPPNRFSLKKLFWAADKNAMVKPKVHH